MNRGTPIFKINKNLHCVVGKFQHFDYSNHCHAGRVFISVYIFSLVICFSNEVVLLVKIGYFRK